MCAFPHQVSRPLEHLWDSKGHPPVNHSCYRLAEDVQVLSGSGNARYDYDLFIGMVGFFFNRKIALHYHMALFFISAILQIVDLTTGQRPISSHTIHAHTDACSSSYGFS